MTNIEPEEPRQNDGRSLVQYCQKVLIANIDAISSFGEDIPLRLVMPILQGCSPDTLSRLERETPVIQGQTSELWRDHCKRSFPASMDELLAIQSQTSAQWHDLFFHLRKREETRFEEAANKIRIQRQEAEELKRKRQVKVTDRLPTMKKVRHGWDGPAPPKTLFERTRREASRFQRNTFGSASLLPSQRNKSSRSQEITSRNGFYATQSVSAASSRSTCKRQAIASKASESTQK